VIPRYRSLHALIGPAILLAICIGFYWKLLLTRQYTWLDGPDTAYQILPWFQFQAGEWHQGRFPLWDPYLWGGQSLIGQAQPGAAYPINWLLFSLPLRNGWIRQSYLHWYYVLIHYQGALFCYWLCRDLKRSRAAAIIAGFVFAFSGYVGTTDWPQMLNGAIWAPLVFLFLLRAVRGERPWASAACSGACLGVAFLSGHHQIPIFIGLAAGGTWIYYLLREGLDWKVARCMAVFGLFVVLCGALQTLPAYEYGKTALRWVSAKEPVTWNQVVPYNVHARYSFGPMSLLGIVIPGIHLNANPYMGLTAVALALIAVLGCWKEHMVRLFCALAAGGLILALGEHSVFHGVLYGLVPMVEKARNPSMAVLILNFALSILIAYGIDTYEFRYKVAKGLLWVAAALLALMLVLAVTKAGYDPRLGVSAIVALFLSGALHLTARRASVLCLGGLALLELGNSAAFSFQQEEQFDSLLKKLAYHKDIAEFLAKQGTAVRVDLDDQEIPYNFGDWYGIDHFGGYLASLTQAVYRAQADMKARDMYGVNYSIVKSRGERIPARPEQREVFTSTTGLKVFRNPSALPRTWIVHEISSISSDEEVVPSLDYPTFDPRRQVFVKGQAPQLESCSAVESSRLVERSAQRVILEAELRCRGMLILGDTYDRGWQVTIDGRPAPLHAAYTFLRGVVVDGGNHRIEMRYRPSSVLWGAALTGLGLIAALGLQALRI
jgi:hypothetical protein